MGSKSTNNTFISFTDRIFIISQTDKVLPFDQDDIISESWPLSRAKSIILLKSINTEISFFKELKPVTD